MNTAEKLKLLRKQMQKAEMDAYIIPSADAHQSEYVAEHFKARQWLSGFTGSAGTVVVTMSDAGLWTDGRYYIQAAKQLEGSGIRLFKAADPETQKFTDWLKDQLHENQTVGLNGMVVDAKSAMEWKTQLAEKQLRLNTELDLIDEIWTERPQMPVNPLFLHHEEYAGETRAQKLTAIRQDMAELGANSFLLASLDDIAWLLNVRGSDVPNNPVVLCYLLVTMHECILFIDQKKVPLEIVTELKAEGITLQSYQQVTNRLSAMNQSDTILYDASRISIKLINAIGNDVKRIEKMNITTSRKAIKNEIELANLKQCMVQDGVALVKLIKWLKENVGKITLTEMDVDEKLSQLRKDRPLFISPSFDSIIGYRENAAMMHYKATMNHTKTLDAKGLLLIDSGGQYLNGTTDTTRTIVLGELSNEEKTDFTLVLKGMIALGSASFLYGVSGHYLDVLARQPLWQHGIDYKCGTGHGIGFFLNVHEGPQRFAVVPNEVRLERGMVITNEPGIYKEGRHGIRTENVLVIVDQEVTEFGKFMQFEDLTLCPIDLDAIVPEMLEARERNWLNAYHQKVFRLLSPMLDQNDVEWLRHQTRSI